MIDRICRRLSEDFQKQPISMQELMRVRLVRLKIGLYSCVPSGHQKAADCHAKLSLYAIASVLKGMLRPKVVAATDKVSCRSVLFKNTYRNLFYVLSGSPDETRRKEMFYLIMHSPYLWLDVIEHIVMDKINNERGHTLLPLYGTLWTSLSISSNRSFMCTFPQTSLYIGLCYTMCDTLARMKNG